MYLRAGLFVFCLLATSWASDARNLGAADLLGVENASGNIDMCSLCEEYATLALKYLEEDKTQAQVIQDLHKACYQLHGLTEQCITLVDYYAPLFFMEVSSVQPNAFCKQVGLCRNAMIASLSRTTVDECDLCRRAIDKLKDPETKLAIVEVLIKACSLWKGYALKCKNMVFEFAPLILTNAEKLIEKADICNRYACINSQAEEAILVEGKLVEGKIEMVISS